MSKEYTKAWIRKQYTMEKDTKDRLIVGLLILFIVANIVGPIAHEAANRPNTCQTKGKYFIPLTALGCFLSEKVEK